MTGFSRVLNRIRIITTFNHHESCVSAKPSRSRIGAIRDKQQKLREKSGSTVVDRDSGTAYTEQGQTANLTSLDLKASYSKSGRKIEYLSVAWTSLEALIGIIAGLIAGSVSLLGFGVDSIIEVVSSMLLIWRLADHPDAEKREATAHRLVGVGFLALGGCIFLEALRQLATHSPPRVSYFGMAYALASIVVMPLLARAKRRVAAQLGSHALHADSHQSDICAYLAVILLVGLSLNALLGWWWADPVAALCMVPIILKEGVSGMRGEPCSHHHKA